MAIDPRKTLPGRTPVAAPARPRLEVSTAPEDDVEDAGPLTPESITGWAWSVGIHALILVVMALWYFAPREKPPNVFDARLAGNEFGVVDGLELHGGFDTALGPDEGMMADPLQPTPLESAGAQLAVAADSFKLGLSQNADAGGGRDRDRANPGLGDGQGFGIARFGDGGETIRGVQVKVGDPQFTLIWDTDVNLDLHIVEPGGAEIYWEVREGKRGGELDVDDRDGLGPENIYWLTDGPDGTRVKGRGPAGEYRWFVHYFGGLGGIDKPTNWKVRVKHDGRVDLYNGRLTRIDQRSKVYALKFGEALTVPRPDRLLDGVIGNKNAGQ